ncbi:ribosome-binding factor A, partial [Candidatus Acetothermia bacterium]
MARLREEIQRELAAIIEFESRDPIVREAFPTVMDVRLSVDARYAKVYVAAAAPTDKEILL